MSSIRAGNGRSTTRRPRTATRAGSGKATGFGLPSPGYSPVSTTSTFTPVTDARSGAPRVVAGGAGNPLRGQLVHTATMLAVGDLGASVDYYQQRLGFRIRERQDAIALLELEMMRLYLVTQSPPTADKPDVTIAPPSNRCETPVNLVFRVKDCRATYVLLKRRGVEFLTAPQSPPWGGWRVFTRDPDGYLIEIEEPRADIRRMGRCAVSIRCPANGPAATTWRRRSLPPHLR